MSDNRRDALLRHNVKSCDSTRCHGFTSGIPYSVQTLVRCAGGLSKQHVRILTEHASATCSYLFAELYIIIMTARVDYVCN
jgi:hypothetical protein